MKYNPETTSVGIKINSNMKNNSKIESVIQKWLRSFYSLMDIDQKPKQLHPKTNLSLYKKIVIPSVLYGCETWCSMTAEDTTKINKFHRHCCKKIQGLNKQTRSAMAESMCGFINLTTEIDKRRLSFSRFDVKKYVVIKILGGYLYASKVCSAACVHSNSVDTLRPYLNALFCQQIIGSDEVSYFGRSA